MRMAAAAVVALLCAFPALAREPARHPRMGDCLIRIGPNDRIARNEALVVKDGESVDSAIALRGDVVVQRGAKVGKAVALGGSVTLEEGAVVAEDAVAIGGDVELAKGARIEKDAVALGGRVRLAKGASVAGGVLGLSLQLGQELQTKILKELEAEGKACRIELEAD
jgi:UDP-3-O-[3-hydroxymyristoyl] glucosamine N-acyltransferase